MGAIGEQAAQLQREWETDPRWAGITRDYSARDVIGLRGCVAGEHRVASHGASRLWDLLHRQDAAPTLGAVVGDRAAAAARSGLPPSTCRAGKRATRVRPGAAIPVSRRTRATPCRTWSAGSTTRC